MFVDCLGSKRGAAEAVREQSAEIQRSELGVGERGRGAGGLDPARARSFKLIRCVSLPPSAGGELSVHQVRL